MKKLFALALVVFGLAACQTEPEGLDVQMGGEQEVMLTVSLPETTRANSAEGAFGNVNWGTYSLRYILEIYRDGDTNGTCQRHVLVSDNKSVAFPVRLAPGYDYNVVVWADIVEGNSQADRYYDTQNGLDEITIIENNEIKWNAMDETRDAYTATVTFNNFQVSQLNETIRLTRPFAKLRVVATDYEDVDKLGLKPATATVVYSQDNLMPRTYNARTGEATGAASKSHAISYATPVYDDHDATGEYTLFADYIFVPESSTTVKFSLDVYADDAKQMLIKSNNFNTEIFVQRNKLTTIKGDVLTVGGNVEVKVENELDELETINYADNAETLQEIINEAPAGEQTNITLGGDINLGDLLNAGILSTRAAAKLPIVIPEDKVVTLDLNGFKLTTPFVEGSETNHTYAFENHGSLTIQDSKGNGEIIARGNFNYGSMTLESGKINACDHNGGYGVRNYKGTFTMNGGTIVASNENGDDRVSGNYDASPLRVDANATATIKGGNITNVSNYTVAIDNYGTTTIEGGTFTSVHSTIANAGTMTIKGDATTIKCEGEYTSAHPIYANGEASNTYVNGGNFIGNNKASCYYVAAEKNTNVYISGGIFTNAGQAAFTGEGNIVVTGGQFDKDPSARVVEGYKAVEGNNVWTVVVDPAAKIGSTEYDTLQEAFNVGGEITLLRDVNLVEAVTLAEGTTVVLNLNGKTINNATGYVIENNGNLTITGNGKLTGLGNIRSNSGALTIENGTYTCSSNWSTGTYNHILKSKNTETIINGGTFDATIGGTNNAMINVSENSVVTINGGEFRNVKAGETIPQFAAYQFTYEKNGKLIINDGSFYGGWRFNGETTTTDIYGGQFTVSYDGQSFHAGSTHVLTVYGGVFYLNNGGKLNPTNYVAEGYNVIEKDNTYTVIPTVLEDGDVLDLGGAEYDGTITVEGNVTIKGDTKIKTLKSTTGCTITIEDGKTLTLNNFSFGAKENANAVYEIKGGTVTAGYGFFQHGKYTLRSNFETGYMYYSYGSDITVYGTFHSQGKGDGLDYVRGKLTIAKGGKSIHDKSLWVGQPASWGAMNASLVIEEGGYVQANSISVYEGSSLTYSNDADLKYNSVTGTEYITKK